MTGRLRPVIVVTGRHRPHELLFLALSSLFGVAYTLAAPPPQSVAATMPGWTVRIWAIGLLVSGVSGLASTLLPLRLDRGLSVELGAMLIGAGALVVTTTAILSSAGLSRGSFGVGFCSAWALANLWRAFQIFRDLRELR